LVQLRIAPKTPKPHPDFRLIMERYKNQPPLNAEDSKRAKEI